MNRFTPHTREPDTPSWNNDRVGPSGWCLRALSGAGLSLVYVLIAICTTDHASAEGFDLRESIPWSEKAKPREPDRMVAVWTHTVLNRPGKPGVRGFGGRVMFYERRSDEPIKVEGELMVFTFDDTSRDGTNCTPDRKYVFTAEQMPEHYSKSKIGHSYSVWIPWDVVGGPQRKISLVARFESKEGNVVTSQINTQILPGIAPVAAKGPAATGVQAASHVMPAHVGGQTPQVGGIPLEPATRQRMSTATIEVAPGIMSRSPPHSVHEPGTNSQQAVSLPSVEHQQNWQPPAPWQARPPWQPQNTWQPQNGYQPQPGWQPPPSGAFAPRGTAQAPAAPASQEMGQPAMYPPPAASQPMVPQPAVQYKDRSGLPGFQAQAVPVAPPRPAGAQMRPRHAGWPSGPPQTPRSAPGAPSQAPAAIAAPGSQQYLR